MVMKLYWKSMKKRDNNKHIHWLLLSSLLFVFSAAIATENDQQQRWWRGSKPPEPMQVISTTVNAAGVPLEIVIVKGRAHNHPLMAIWVEDLEGNYIQTLYVAESIAKGVYLHGDASTGRWLPGPIRRPAALPYWGHQRGVQAEDGLYMPSQKSPMADAVTGPTPKGNFTLKTQTPKPGISKFRILMEINQPWDWNQHWYNNKFPDDREYMTSAQPAVVYEAMIDLTTDIEIFEMKPIGHSHWSGKTGKLYNDLMTLTTALNILDRAFVRVPEKK
jgi:hypothetical protein